MKEDTSFFYGRNFFLKEKVLGKYYPRISNIYGVRPSNRLSGGDEMRLSPTKHLSFCVRCGIVEI